MTRANVARAATTSLLMVVYLLSAAPDASATQIIGAEPLQQWANESKVATPPQPVEVIPVELGGCGFALPGEDDAGQAFPACALPPNKIGVVRAGWLNRFTFYHELGHDFDAQVLTDPLREEFLALLGLTGRPWYYTEPGVDIHDTAPSEFFAMTYEDCAFWGIHLRNRWERWGRALPLVLGPIWIKSVRRRGTLCRFIDDV